MLTAYDVFWLFGFPAMLFSWYHIVRNAIAFIPANSHLVHNPYPRIIFQIAARRQTRALSEPVEQIRRSCAEVQFSNYEIRLVVDEIEDAIEGARTILVPADFVCRSRFKARALHYALGYLPGAADTWTLHLDEDALVTPQGVASMVSYITTGGKPVANGPTIFPYDGNFVTFFAEAQRQWTFYWLRDQLARSTVHWLNGSNLLIRSDVEHTVGWDFPNCYISEDARFGYEATKKCGEVFGWHGGLTVEKPPASVRALIKQRMRWFFGSILNLRYVPRERLPRRIYAISVWLNGFVLTVLFAILFLGVRPAAMSPGIVAVGASISVTFWLGRYQVGVWQNLRRTPMGPVKRIALHLGIVPLVPVIDLLCSIPAVLALIKPPRVFEITAKSG